VAGTGRFQAYGIKGSVTVGGSTASTISDVGQANGHINVGGVTAGTQTTFQVNDVTGTAATDLLVSAKLQNHAAAGSLAEVSTGIIKAGAGKMELTDVSRYTGETTVAAGKLALSGSGSVATSSVINVQSGAFLDVSAVTTPWELATTQSLIGNGTILGAATVAGNIAPGSSIGALNFSDTLALAGIVTMKLDAGASTSDLLAVASSMVFGGTLNVSNLNGNLTLGQSFNLFDFGSATGAFGEVNLPTLDGGLAWDQSQLYTTGQLAVVPEPAVLVFAPLSLCLLVRRRRQLP
jgi:autotransporter-associated beta strand protein